MSTQYVDLERVVEERLIRGMRRVFEFDDEFRYNLDHRQSGIIITPDYPKGEDERPFKTPQILVSGISLQVDLQSGLTNSMQRDVAYNGIKNYAQEHFFRSPFTASYVCTGEYDISRNVANRVLYYLSFRARDYFSNSLQLNLGGVSKGATAPREQHPEAIFQTPVNVQGFCALSVIQTPFNYLEGNESKPIDRLDETFVDVTVDLSKE